jgi:rod shape-determining protein MreD
MARVVVAGVIVTYVLAVLQATLGGRMAIHGVAPDLLFLWTICVGLLSGGPAGALVGFGAGLMEGSLQHQWVGAYGISKTLSGLGAGLLATKMFKENWVVPLVCAVLLTVVNEVVFLVFSGAGGWEQASRIIGVRVVYHGALAPVAFALVRRGRRALLGRPEEAA